MTKILKRIFMLLAVTLVLLGFNGMTVQAALPSGETCDHSSSEHFKWSGTVNSSGNYVGTYYFNDGTVNEDARQIKSHFTSGKSPTDLPDNVWWYNAGEVWERVLKPCTGHVAPHSHNFTYSASNSTLTATCSADGCGLTDKKVSLTLNATSANYSGSSVTANYGSGDADAWKAAVGSDAPTITYEKKGTDSTWSAIDSAPSAVGEYRAVAKVTKDSTDYIAYKEFTISKAEISSVAFTEPTEPAYGGTPASSVTGTGETYSGAISWSPAATTFGYSTVYTATITLTAAENYLFKSDVIIPTNWTKSDTSTDTSLVITRTYTATENAPHEHGNFDTSWTQGTSGHWYACGNAGCDVENESGASSHTSDGFAYAAHSYGTSGTARYTCSVCSYVDAAKKEAAEAADLAAAKDSAKAAIAAEKGTDTSENVASAVTTAEAAIDAATTIDGVTAAKDAGITAIKNAKAVNDTIEKIDAIGTVTYTSASKEKIDAARAAYDALSDDLKSQITNIDKLTDAEKEYDRLKPKSSGSSSSTSSSPFRQETEDRTATEERMVIAPIVIDRTLVNRGDMTVIPGGAYNLSKMVTASGIARGIDAAVAASNKSGSNTATIYSGKPLCFNTTII